MADTPEDAIARLDGALARRGETVVIRRLTLGPNSLQVPFDATCRAHVRPMKGDELVGNVDQSWSAVILSPTDLAEAQFPMPIRKGDKAVIQGKARNIEFSGPILEAGVLVRIELQVSG